MNPKAPEQGPVPQHQPKIYQTWIQICSNIPQRGSFVFFLMDGTPFCPKARLAAVAQQNNDKIYKNIIC